MWHGLPVGDTPVHPLPHRHTHWIRIQSGLLVQIASHLVARSCRVHYQLDRWPLGYNPPATKATNMLHGKPHLQITNTPGYEESTYLLCFLAKRARATLSLLLWRRSAFLALAASTQAARRARPAAAPYLALHTNLSAALFAADFEALKIDKQYVKGKPMHKTMNVDRI